MWIVPVTSCCGSYDAQKKFLLKDKTDKINIEEFAASQSADGEKNQNIWIKLNIDQTGFYRVKYDDELAAGLVNAIKAKKLSLMDKIGKDKKNLALLYTFSRFLTRCHILLAGIVEDSYALSVACKQTLTSLLRLLNAYNDESDYTVLSHVTSVSNLAPPVDSKTLYLQINYVAFDVPIKYQIHVSSFLAGMLKHF